MADQAKPLVERLNEALDDGLVEFVKAELTTLANRLGADKDIVTPEAERDMAESAIRNGKTAHDFMRAIVAKVFGEGAK